MKVNLKQYIKDVPDFPKPGILFRDIMPILGNPAAFTEVVNLFTVLVDKYDVDVIVSPEARGFLFGPTVARQSGVPFVPVRKSGKLPGELISATYDLEYGTNELFMQVGTIKPHQKVLIIDDLLATGGTINAVKELIETVKAEVVAAAFIVELTDLPGRAELKPLKVDSLIKY